MDDISSPWFITEVYQLRQDIEELELERAELEDTVDRLLDTVKGWKKQHQDLERDFKRKVKDKAMATNKELVDKSMILLSMVEEFVLLLAATRAGDLKLQQAITDRINNLKKRGGLIV